MAIVTMNKVNSIYSEIISNYLNKGYNISTSTAGGSYSDEVCHIDLVPKHKSNELLRVWMTRGFENLSVGWGWHVNTITISVRKYDLGKRYTYWYEKGTPVGDELKFYEIRDKQAYTDSIDECKDIVKLREGRYDQRYFKDKYLCDRQIDIQNVPSSVKDSIIRRIKQVKGAKRASNWDCIKTVTLKNYDSNVSGRRLYAQVYWEFNSKNGYLYINR